jgi:hypothetical protein
MICQVDEDDDSRVHEHGDRCHACSATHAVAKGTSEAANMCPKFQNMYRGIAAFAKLHRKWWLIHMITMRK